MKSWGGGGEGDGAKEYSFEESYISCWNEGGKDRRVVNVFERRIFSFFVSFFFWRENILSPYRIISDNPYFIEDEYKYKFFSREREIVR